MMELDRSASNNKKNGDTSRKFVAERWIPVGSAASPRLKSPMGASFEQFGTQLNTLNYIVTICLARLMIGRFMRVTEAVGSF